MSGARAAAPRVTVVVPSYKHGHYLGECLESLQQQDLEAWEAIVVDDASPDIELVERVIAELADPRIRLLRHEVNRGLAASRNTGIRAATSELVLPLDADDKLEPEALGLLSRAIEQGDLDAAYADVQLFGRAEEVLTFPGPRDDKLLHIADTIPGAGTMMRRDLWERVGGYDEHDALRAGREDFEFWMRAFRLGLHVERIRRPLYLYRISHTSMSLACRREDHLVTRYMAEKHRELFDSVAEKRRFIARGYARASLARHESGDRRASIGMALRALRFELSERHLRLLGRSLVTPKLARRLTSGEVRRLIPFATYPMRGEARYAPFFIIGAPRSGTTLLRRVLTSHSALHIPPETFVLGEILRGFRRWGRGLNWGELVSLVLSRFEFHPEFHTFGISLGALARRLSNVPTAQRNLAHVLDAFYRYHAEQHHVTVERWGDKTPLNTLEQGTLEALRDAFPDARFIHLVRDGCDVAYSHVAGGFMRDLVEAGRQWADMTQRARRFAALHPRNSIEVRYESLVRDPRREIERLCGFLDIDLEEAMLRSEERAGELGDVPEWYWHQEVARPIHPDNIGKGRRYLSTEEKAGLQAVIGRELAAHDYPPADSEDQDDAAREARG